MEEYQIEQETEEVENKITETLFLNQDKKNLN